MLSSWKVSQALKARSDDAAKELKRVPNFLSKSLKTLGLGECLEFWTHVRERQLFEVRLTVILPILTTVLGGR